MESFKIKEVLRFGWQKTKENLWFLVLLELAIYAVNILAGSSVVGFLVGLLTGLVLTQVFFRISLGEKVTWKNLFAFLTTDKAIHYLLATIITSIFVIVGLFLLIVPGIIVAIMTIFVPFIILETRAPSFKDLSFWKAIKRSYQMTKGKKWKIFTFLLVAVLVNILGLIALGVGLLVSAPVTGIALAAVYNKMKGQHQESAPAEVVA